MNRKRIVSVTVLAMALGACGHASAGPSRTSLARKTSATSYRSLFLAANSSEQQATVTGGQVIVEHADCDPWAGAPARVCSVETMLEGSIP